jgi:hypothetical protein
VYRRHWVSAIAVELRSIRFFGVDAKSSGDALLLINPTRASAFQRLQAESRSPSSGLHDCLQSCGCGVYTHHNAAFSLFKAKRGLMS